MCVYSTFEASLAKQEVMVVFSIDATHRDPSRASKRSCDAKQESEVCATVKDTRALWQRTGTCLKQPCKKNQLERAVRTRHKVSSSVELHEFCGACLPSAPAPAWRRPWKTPFRPLARFAYASICVAKYRVDVGQQSRDVPGQQQLHLAPPFPAFVRPALTTKCPPAPRPTNPSQPSAPLLVLPLLPLPLRLLFLPPPLSIPKQRFALQPPPRQVLYPASHTPSNSTLQSVTVL